jgi:lipid-A-disaccharide synthase-like uncharacterized protein
VPLSFFIALLVSGYIRCEYGIQRTNEMKVNVRCLVLVCTVISLMLIKSEEKEEGCELNKCKLKHIPSVPFE